MLHDNYRNWKIRTVSVVDGGLFAAAAVLELDPEVTKEEPRRFKFAGLGQYESTDEADQRAIEWAREWIDRKNDETNNVRRMDDPRRD